MAEEYKKPDHIKKAEKYHKASKLLIDTTEHYGEKAFIEAIDEHLVNEETGSIEYKRLKDNNELQGKFADSVADKLRDAAKGKFNIDKDLDEAEEEMLLNAYAGITRQEMYTLVKTHHKDFRKGKQEYEQIREKFLEQTSQRLYSNSVGHIGDEHLDDVLEYSGLEEKLQKGKLTTELVRKILLNTVLAGGKGKLGYVSAKQILPDYVFKEEKDEKEE